MGLYGIGRDITHEYKARKNYQRELDYLANMHKTCYVSLLMDITDWKLMKMGGYASTLPSAPNFASIDDFKKYTSERVVEDVDVKRFLASMTRESLRDIYDSGRRVITMEYMRRMPDGAERWVRGELRFLLNPDTWHIMIFFILIDIDDSKRSQKELARAAEEDSMTGLLDHDATFKHITRYLEMEGTGGTHALFMIDVDNFKIVNDTFGHQTGDDVITDIASAIKKTFRDTDIVGRVGGDEFMALMKNAPNKSVVARKAAELIEAMQYDLKTGRGAVTLSGSAGISIYHGDGKTLESLYNEADAALYGAKLDGKNRYEFANSESGGEEGLSPSETELLSSVHLRTLINNMEGGVLICSMYKDGDIKIEYVSPSSFKTFNRERDELGENGQNIFSLVLPEYMDDLRNSIRATAATGELTDFTYQVYTNNGQDTAWRHLRASCLPENTVPRRIVCVITDITKIKESEESLRQ